MAIVDYNEQNANQNAAGFIAYKAIISIDLWLPVWILLLISRDISFTEIAIADGIHRLVTVILEVPTGVISDKWGHRTSLIVGSISFAAALITLTFTYNFQVLLLSWVLWSIALSLISGADEAFLYESLSAGGLKEKYRRRFGLSQTAALIATAVGSFAAGFLFAYHPMSPTLINAVFVLIAVGILLMLHSLPGETNPGKTLTTNNLKNMRQELAHPGVTPLVMISAVGTTLFWAGTLFYQPYLVELDIPLNLIGIVYVTFQIAGALGARFSTILTGKIGDKLALLFLLSILWIAGLPMALQFTPWAIVGIAIIWTSFYATRTVTSDLLQNLVGSKNRATVGSIRNFAGSLMLIFIRVIAGVVSDRYGLQNGLIVMTALSLPGAIYALILVRKIQPPTRLHQNP